MVHASPKAPFSTDARCVRITKTKLTFIGEHGSWDRYTPYGYKVVYVPFAGGRPSGKPVDVVTGFVDAKADKGFGRPVGVAVDRFGALLVADDFGNVVWRVTPSGWRPSEQPQTAHAT